MRQVSPHGCLFIPWSQTHCGPFGLFQVHASRDTTAPLSGRVGGVSFPSVLEGCWEWYAWYDTCLNYCAAILFVQGCGDGAGRDLWMRLLWLPGRVWRCQDSSTCTFVLKLLLNILCPLWLTAFACHYGYLKLPKSLLMIPASCWWCLHTGTIILRQEEAGQDSNS
jgi:hypothetical protein